ncbi:hypothetical protein GDO81_014350 [Engystomops pustulosus]|uniref:Apolipoprotein C-II n=1 Tax=Engystomops pustulosus TaxID=76066 RepID=A0AAV7B9P3_ENGPU|nr:hypothetical protein GDO81_014350 [Engystomops pustulosus]
MKLLISCILILFLGVCTGMASEEQQHSEAPHPPEEESNATLFSVIEKWFDVAKVSVDSSQMVTKAKSLYSTSTDFLEGVYDWTLNAVMTQWKKITD